MLRRDLGWYLQRSGFGQQRGCLCDYTREDGIIEKLHHAECQGAQDEELQVPERYYRGAKSEGHHKKVIAFISIYTNIPLINQS